MREPNETLSRLYCELTNARQDVQQKAKLIGRLERDIAFFEAAIAAAKEGNPKEVVERMLAQRQDLDKAIKQIEDEEDDVRDDIRRLTDKEDELTARRNQLCAESRALWYALEIAQERFNEKKPWP